MAEISGQSGGGHKDGGKVRSKKMSTRIDFTPMVDLGFLLITFFMLTTTLNKPQTMEINMPVKDKTKDLPPVKESQVITLLLGDRDKIYYYSGITEAKLDSTDFSADGIRKVLLDKKNEVQAKFPTDRDPTIVLIKANDDSNYKNLVDIIDEMHISRIARFVLMDISEVERAFILNPSAGLQYNPTEQGAK